METLVAWTSVLAIVLSCALPYIYPHGFIVQLVMKFSALMALQVTVVTQHRSISWTSWIQPTFSHVTPSRPPPPPNRVGIATRIRDGQLRKHGSIPSRGKRFPHLRNVQTGTGVHPAPHTITTMGCFSGVKVAGAWSWPFILIECRR
jgi:hypothetical protein